MALRAIVTGGASGIGAAVADTLRASGARVIVFDRDVPAGEDAIQVDVTDAAGVSAAVADAVARLGGLDVLVNNAGIGAAGTVEDNSDEEWHRVYDVNVVGMVRMSRAALPALRQSASAAIVNTCSVAATAGLPQRALYSASKGAVLSLTLAMAADHVGEGIRVNCVCPGPVDTPMLWAGEGHPDAAARESARTAGRNLAGRSGRPDEIAATIAFLLSGQVGFMTGSIVTVDGGWTAG